MLLVRLANAVQDVDRLFDGRLFDHHLLEAAFQRGVVFDVAAVLIERRRANALQLAARQRRLEDVGRVHAAARRASTDQHVHLVDEQDAVGLLELLDHALEAFLELAAVHRAGHQRANVQLEHALSQQRRGRVARHDALGQPFDDGRLADTRLADERRVVLLAAAQDLDDALDLHLAPDHRIELAFFGQRGEVGRQLVDHRRLDRGAGGAVLGRLQRAARRLQRVLLQHAARLAPNLIRADAQFLEDVHRDAFGMAHQAQQQMFGSDIVMTHATGFVDGQLEHLLGRRR